MPVTKTIPNRQLIPLLNELARLTRWLRPGTLSLKVARIKAAVEKPTVQFNDQAEKLIDELVIFDEQGDGDEKKKVRRRKKHDTQPNVEVWDFGPRTAEFEKRDKELRDGETEITFGSLLTAKDIEKMEKSERIEKMPRNAEGAPIALDAPDFSALLPVIEDETPAPAPAAKPADEAGVAD